MKSGKKNSSNANLGVGDVRKTVGGLDAFRPLRHGGCIFKDTPTTSDLCDSHDSLKYLGKEVAKRQKKKKRDGGGRGGEGGGGGVEEEEEEKGEEEEGHGGEERSVGGRRRRRTSKRTSKHGRTEFGIRYSFKNMPWRYISFFSFEKLRCI